MNTEFIIDDGSKEYTFKNQFGKVIAKLVMNPSDTGLVERYEQLVSRLNELDIPKDSDAEILSKINQDISQSFNEFIGVDADLFSVCRPLSPVANGDLFCEVLMDKLGEIIVAETGARLNKKKAKIKRMTEKNRK